VRSTGTGIFQPASQIAVLISHRFNHSFGTAVKHRFFSPKETELNWSILAKSKLAMPVSVPSMPQSSPIEVNRRSTIRRRGVRQVP
jgi:hypothetical protein